MHKCLGITRTISRSFTSLPNFFKISEEVTESLSSNKPIVALESTVITHGLPFPENVKTATKVEEIVRQNNAIPATIGILNGKVYIGMNPTEMTSLALNKNVLKVSRRDLPYLISQCLSGGTTVAATMALAYRSGISVFATGGIGGVHRGGETSMDVSADLCELSRTPIAVFFNPETLGVCVAAFGASKDFPAFFTPKSNFKAPCNVESYEEAARLIDSRNQLQLESGILIAVPIPEEYHEQGLQTESVIEEALNEARERNILGRDVTPFVLKRVQELSGGAALEANIGLLQNNARVGAQIAVALNHLNSSRSGPISSRTLRSPVKQEAKDVFSSPSGRPVVIGGSILDIHVKTLEDVKIYSLPSVFEIK
ncbi:Pseudouridine-5'-phosphate glycosidase like protein [Argiope bruennichi]|uniref:Pseudouridine-5'-phosphate glycosidase like protein n=1 Tax=Argiope bruennichi TaxID=94029 RepID=A0A8T0FRF0_ARGBR|nr:Pseudouridine-5'-phosphate glycosidase like protein [Argiope bruennichi]